MFRQPPIQRDRFVEKARDYVGYRCRPGGLSDFSQETGYHGHEIPWSGAWVDHVARETEVMMPACVYGPGALAEFVQTGRFYLRPEPGDVAFFAFPTVVTGPSAGFAMPHVGIVVSTADNGGKFLTVEAQVSAGLPRGSKDPDGIYERTRWIFETTGFGRPNFRARPGIDATPETVISFSNVRTGKGSSEIALVQTALLNTCDLREYATGTWDTATRRAFARWQRRIGRAGSDAAGLPVREDLERLGLETGLFRLR
jgi:hypothetical protein